MPRSNRKNHGKGFTNRTSYRTESTNQDVKLTKEQIARDNEDNKKFMMILISLTIVILIIIYFLFFRNL